MALAWQGRYDASAAAITSVLGAAKANNNVGYIAMLKGDYGQAISRFKKALALSPRFYVRADQNLQRAKRLQKESVMNGASERRQAE